MDELSDHSRVSTNDSNASSSSAEESNEGEFRIEDLRDRVVIMLLHEQAVREEQVQSAWMQWREMKDARVPLPLWRVLAIHAGIDAERVFEEAARVYAFDKVDLSSTYSVAEFIREHRGDFTDEQWDRMAELSVIPVRVAYGKGGEEYWTFATYDPGHPAINTFLNGLDIEELAIHYAPLAEVEAVLGVVFPDQADAWARLKPALGPDDEAGEAAQDDTSDAAEEAAISPKTLLNVFEEILVNTVREGVPQVYLVPNAQRAVEVHFIRDGELRHWATIKRIPAEVLMGFMKGWIIKTHALEPGEPPKTVVRRWIDDRHVQFKVELSSVQPTGTAVETEVVRISMMR